MNLADATVAADSVPLPVVLGDVSVTVTDNTGHSGNAPLLFVSRGQINYPVPGDCAPGEALVTVSRAGTVVAAGVIQIEAVVPGLFSANGDGMGVAAGWAVTATAGGAQTSQLLFQGSQSAGGYVPAPVDLGAEGNDVVPDTLADGFGGTLTYSDDLVAIHGPTAPPVRNDNTAMGWCFAEAAALLIMGLRTDAHYSLCPGLAVPFLLERGRRADARTCGEGRRRVQVIGCTRTASKSSRILSTTARHVCGVRCAR